MRILVLFCWGLSVFACSAPNVDAGSRSQGAGGDGPASPQVDCNGGTTLALGIRLHTPSESDPVIDALGAPGFSFLYLNRDCTYWVQPAGTFEPTVTGQMTVKMVNKLLEDLSFSAWNDVAGEWPNPDSLHAGWTVMSDGEYLIARGPRLLAGPERVEVCRAQE